MFENRKYVIVTKAELDNVDFSKVMQTSKATCRYSKNGGKAILKYEGSQPSFLSGKTEYTNAQILEKINITDKSEWEPDGETD